MDHDIRRNAIHSNLSQRGGIRDRGLLISGCADRISSFHSQKASAGTRQRRDLYASRKAGVVFAVSPRALMHFPPDLGNLGPVRDEPPAQRAYDPIAATHRRADILVGG